MLKRFYFDEQTKTVTLVSENPSCPPKIFTGADTESIRIFGRAILKQSPII